MTGARSIKALAFVCSAVASPGKSRPATCFAIATPFAAAFAASLLALARVAGCDPPDLPACGWTIISDSNNVIAFEKNDAQSKVVLEAGKSESDPAGAQPTTRATVTLGIGTQALQTQ